MKIKITDFAKRHFDKNFGGTKILDISIEDVEININNSVVYESLDFNLMRNVNSNFHIDTQVMSGYAPFCKLLIVPNFTNAKVGSIPITLENYQYLRSGYSARRETELPILSRWFELPIEAPKAKYLVFVLYSKEQIDKEAKEEYSKQPDLKKYESFDADWGVVAILGQSHNNEEPMKPETMLRNALGIEEGGSGVKIDREKYLASVEFWDKNTTVK